MDNIYVADFSESIKYRKECFLTTDYLSESQYRRCIALRGIKIVTLKDYIEQKIIFLEPQYLIRKEIGYDEITKMWHITKGNPIDVLLNDNSDKYTICL